LVPGDTLSNAYEPRKIEQRWQSWWEDQGTFRAPNPGDPDFDASQPKFYVLDMFPYPSGAGLHVGHPMGYIGSDVVARRERMRGYNVLHPMGFDAFGLPAEQYAIETGVHPADFTRKNIDTFRRQLQMIGLSYDWGRELATCDPEFYKWTQWIFTRLFDRGLAYQAEVPVWWCEELKTVLANEEVINGRSERGDHPCERKMLKQWMLKITAYADQLIDDLDLVEWPESVKTMQREWIGRSHGAEVDFRLELEGAEPLTVFTTRPDTLYGATFMVIAPEHPVVNELTTSAQRDAVDGYIKESQSKSDLERTDLAKSKSGVFTGAYALNPLMDASDPKARVPIWVADYVLMGYGTGAIMAVPGHDSRDHEFATKFGVEIREVVAPVAGAAPCAEGECFTGEGVAVNSGELDGMTTAQAKARAIELLEARSTGRSKTTYRLRDWLFSRQRYWGEPFPIIHTEDGETQRLSDSELPVLLPEIDDYAPAADGSAPLARATEWVKAQGADGQPASRETDTMPGWAGSCWYYLRFMDPRNSEAAWSPEAQAYWGNVDLYVGGVEHAVLHLLYSRFWHKVLFDEGLVTTKEPFQRLFNQGMLTAFAYKDSTGRLIPSDQVDLKDGVGSSTKTGEELEQVIAKMSKSLRNVVNPDEVIEEYGCDTFRLYEMFMGPLSDSKPWNPRDVPGCRRFLDRVWRLFVDTEGDAPIKAQLLSEGELEGGAIHLEKQLNRAIQRIDSSFGPFNFNTGIAALMTFVNEATKAPGDFTKSQATRLVLALSPFAPHIAEELWERIGGEGSVCRAQWPVVDEQYLEDDSYELIVQVRGKLRGRVMVPKDAEQAALEAAGRDTVASHLEGKDVVKVVVVPGRLVNFVVK
jgi:leucyl-tRNA synthetase